MSGSSRTLLSYLHRRAAPTLADATLLARWRDQRDQDAFALLMARHGPMVLGVCRRILGDVQDAEDAFQATFLVLARKVAQLRRPEALVSFLYGVAVRLARKAHASAKRRKMVQPSAETPEPVDPRPHPLDVLTGRELLALLDAEIARLPETYRLPLLLCLLQGKTVEDAARQLGWTIGSLRGRLERGREQLRRRLSRRGLGLSVGAIALLAPAVVPEKLLAESLRHLSGPVPAAVSALAAGWTSALKLKAIGLGLFVVVAAGLGAALPLLRPPQQETPSTPSPAAPPARAKDEPLRDQDGDPLPKGAVMRLGTLRYRVPGDIRAVAFAPDGKTIAVSGGDLFLIDAASGKRLRQLTSQRDPWSPETLLAFSPDGKRLAIEGQHDEYDRAAVRVWELDGERLPHEYNVGQSIIWVGWSAKNEPLAIRVDEHGVLHLHDLAAGRSRRFECKEPLKYPNGNVRDPAVACSPAGKVLAAVDNKNVIHVWDTATGRERSTLQPKGDAMRSLTLSPDGGRLVSITPQAVQMWDVARAKALYTVDVNEAKYYDSRAVFTSDGKTLATSDFGRTIRFWDAETGREQGRTEGKGNFAPHFAFSPDGKWLVTTENDSRSIDLWDVATGRRKPERRMGHRSWPHGTAFTPDGRRMATGGGTDCTIHIWDLESGESLTRIRRPNRLLTRGIAFSPDGRSLFSAWDDDNLWISGAVSGERLHVLKLEDTDRPDAYQSPIHTYSSDDGKTLIVLSYYYSKKEDWSLLYQETLITGWDTSTHKQLFRRRRRGTEMRTALSADARVLAVPHPNAKNNPNPSSGGKGPMGLEDVRTGELLLTFPALEGSTWPLAFSPDGRLLASNNFNGKRASKDGQSKALNQVRLWETATAAEVLSPPVADLSTQACVAFTRDNRLMAMAVPRQEIVVWDLLRGCEWRRFKGFDAEVADLAFSPDGRRLISGLADSTWLVWDVGTRNTAPLGKLDAEGLAKAWADLASRDAPRAFRARGALALSPEETVPLLRERLKPAQAADAERLRRLLADLASDEFAVREQAQKMLEEFGDLAEPALRQTLANKPTLEVRRRVQALLERLRGPVTKPETLRALRALAVLEDIGTQEARRLLEELAKGTPEARLTREAKESLRRLDSRNSSGR